jgi:hypothetical protein
MPLPSAVRLCLTDGNNRFGGCAAPFSYIATLHASVNSRHRRTTNFQSTVRQSLTALGTGKADSHGVRLP